MTAPSDQESALLAAIKDFAESEAVYTQANERFKAARKTLLNLFPKEIGEFKADEGNWQVTIKYPEKVKWDAEKLDAIYGSDKPAHVKMSYSIDLRVLRRLPQSEQDQLKGCYEEVPGTPDICVEVK